jgi:broad specificity phosphatase PhoE
MICTAVTLRGSQVLAPQDDGSHRGSKSSSLPTIYYIRHGETQWNAEGRLQGAQDIPLNDLGRKQAAHAGVILADLFARDGCRESSLVFVASPLGRARSTMELVRGTLKLRPGDYAVDDRLREIGYGDWEGSTLAQMQASDPEVFARRQADKWTVPPPGGESYAAVQARVSDWYNDLTADTVAVAHGGTARALMVALGIETPASAADLTIEQGAVYVFGSDGGLRKYS